MSHQDHDFSKDKSSHLLEVTQWLLSGIVFTKKLHMNCSWTFSSVAMTAIFWSWSRESTATERFVCAQRLTRHLQTDSGKATSPQAFMEFLRRHTAYLLEQLLVVFRAHMSSFDGRWKTFGYVLFGVDGTDVSVPRTASNQSAFTTNGKSKHQARKRIKNQNAHQKKQKNCPHILMTTLYHISLGLAWSWRLGSKSDNERTQLLSMLGELPKGAMIVGDAGFTGFEFLSSVLGSGVELVIRVGSNVKLLKQLGQVRESNGIVYIWPAWAMKKNLEPLRFRLVVLNDGKKPVYLITSVLDSKRLSDRQVAKIYSMRWEIELYHRNLKQTMGHRKLLSRSAENALVELHWIVLGYTAMMLYSADELAHQGIDIQRLSPAKVILAFRQFARDYVHPIEIDETLNHKIARALKDQYTRKNSKDSRDYPRKRKRKSPGKPSIEIASKQQKQKAKLIRNQSLAA